MMKPGKIGLSCALLFLLLLATWMLGARAEAWRDSPEKAVESVLAAQTAAWNRGDLEGFMQGYWQSPGLVFETGGKIIRGWQPTLARYRQRYQAPGAQMGYLDFPEQEITMLGKDAALAWGRYRLTMPGGKQAGGVFTLVMRRLPEGWRIVHDHTSAE